MEIKLLCMIMWKCTEFVDYGNESHMTFRESVYGLTGYLVNTCKYEFVSVCSHTSACACAHTVVHG